MGRGGAGVQKSFASVATGVLDRRRDLGTAAAEEVIKSRRTLPNSKPFVLRGLGLVLGHFAYAVFAVFLFAGGN